jgi:tRNA (guanine37-N1)-methyltransferase
MRIDIATLFPEMCERVLSESIIGRARLSGAVDIFCHDIRTFTENKHRRVDDKPYGGGTGMVMAAQPIHDCIISIMTQINPASPRLIYLSPQGKPLTQNLVKELSKESNLILLCGHYEGVDQRVLDALEFEEISIGDYVVTGGELPALVLTDAVVRLQEGVLPDEEAYTIESHYNGLLEFPQYTRPEVWNGRAVPEALLSGHHERIQQWRKEMSLEITKRKRPDLLL